LLGDLVVSPSPVSASPPFGARREDATVQGATTIDQRSLHSSFAKHRAQLLHRPWICRLELRCVFGAERDHSSFDQHVLRALRLHVARCSAGDLTG